MIRALIELIAHVFGVTAPGNVSSETKEWIKERKMRKLALDCTNSGLCILCKEKVNQHRLKGTCQDCGLTVHPECAPQPGQCGFYDCDGPLKVTRGGSVRG